MSLFIFTTQIVGMVNPVILGWIQVLLRLEDPYKNPKLFGMFLLFSTTIPNILSIPCFYYSGLDYVIHKKKEEAVIEAAESYKDQNE